MQKKLIAVAVAGVLAAPLAMAQTNVTISGTLNAGFENISAGGASLANAPATATAVSGTGSLASRTRVVDNSSELRFSMTEDLGGGLQAFGTIGAAVDPGNTNVAASTGSGSLGARNTGVGLRSKQWGEILIGNWDLQWHLMGMIDTMWIKGAAAGNASAVVFTNGRGAGSVAQGGRYGNQIKYQSPSWNGFGVGVQYSRHVEAQNGVATAVQSNYRDTERTWAISPTDV